MYHLQWDCRLRRTSVADSGATASSEFLYQGTVETVLGLAVNRKDDWGYQHKQNVWHLSFTLIHKEDTWHRFPAFSDCSNVRNILIFWPGNYVQKQTPPKSCCTDLIICTSRRWSGKVNLNVLKAAIYPKTSQDHFETHLNTILLMAKILHQLMGSLSLYLQGFVNPRWCRISSVNSMCHSVVMKYLI